MIYLLYLYVLYFCVAMLTVILIYNRCCNSSNKPVHEPEEIWKEIKLPHFGESVLKQRLQDEVDKVNNYIVVKEIENVYPEIYVNYDHQLDHYKFNWPCESVLFLHIHNESWTVIVKCIEGTIFNNGRIQLRNIDMVVYSEVSVTPPKQISRRLKNMAADIAYRIRIPTSLFSVR